MSSEVSGKSLVEIFKLYIQISLLGFKILAFYVIQSVILVHKYNQNLPSTEYLFTECARTEYKCDVSRCIPLSQRCNGVKDCSDGTDEFDCKPGNYLSVLQRQNLRKKSLRPHIH